MKKTQFFTIAVMILSSFSFIPKKDIRYYNMIVEYNNKQNIDNSILLMVNYTDSTFFYYRFSPMQPKYATGKVSRTTDNSLVFQSKYLSHKIPIEITAEDNSDIEANVLSFTTSESSEIYKNGTFGIIINDSINYKCKFSDSIIIKDQITTVQIFQDDLNFLFEKKFLNCQKCRIYCNMGVLNKYVCNRDFDNVQGFCQNQDKRKLLALTPFKFYPSDPDTAYFQETTKRKALKWLKKTVFGPSINSHVERCKNPSK